MNNAKPSNPLIQNFRGVFLPAHEKHLPEWMNTKNQLVDGKPTYQLDKIRAVLALVPADRRRVAIDIGAHCGLWSVHLAKEFEFVQAFEPLALHRECFELNLAPRKNYDLHACALGAENGTVNIYTAPTSSGDSFVNGAGDIPLRTLDEFQFDIVDLIKLDCEGFELFALRGGVRTIFESQPVIIVEQKPGKAQKFGLKETEAVTFLESMGYRMAREISGDFIMVPTPKLAENAAQLAAEPKFANAEKIESGPLEGADGPIAGVAVVETGAFDDQRAQSIYRAMFISMSGDEPPEISPGKYFDIANPDELALKAITEAKRDLQAAPRIAVESASSEDGEAKSVEFAGNPGQEA